MAPDYGYNADLQDFQSQILYRTAQTVYQNALANGATEATALAKAQFEWNKIKDEAGLTGQYQGHPTLSAEQLRGFFGSGAGEFAGMPTTTEQQISGYTDAGQTPTLGRQEFEAGATGYYGGNATLAREAEQNKTTLGYLNTLASLRGPANAFQYARILNGTPGGLRDIINASAGRYQMPANSGGVAPLTMDASGNVVRQAMSTVPYNSGAIAGQPGVERAGLGSMLNDVNGGYGIPQTDALPNMNQIDLNNYAKFNPTQKDLFAADYEYQKGIRPEDLRDAINRSAPAYRGPRQGAYAGLFGA